MVGLIGSVLPDIDVPYFYLIDNRQTLHHAYWIHIPFYWLIIASLVFALIWLFKKRDLFVPAGIFFANIFLHLFLDTMVGKIAWLWPVWDQPLYMFDVPSVYGFWVFNYIFHWTFLFEILLLALAVWHFAKVKLTKSGKAVKSNPN